MAQPEYEQVATARVREATGAQHGPKIFDVDDENVPAASSLTTFEGEAVTEVEGRFPPFVVKMQDGYVRDTHLRVSLEVRVKSVRVEERGKDGAELVRQHVFALVNAEWTEAFDPADAADSIGGSASVYAVPTPEQSADLGVKFGRTSDQRHGSPGF